MAKCPATTERAVKDGFLMVISGDNSRGSYFKTEFNKHNLYNFYFTWSLALAGKYETNWAKGY